MRRSEILYRQLQLKDIEMCAVLRGQFTDFGFFSRANQLFWRGFMRGVWKTKSIFAVVAVDPNADNKVVGYTIGAIDAENLSLLLVLNGGWRILLGLLELCLRSPIKSLKYFFAKNHIECSSKISTNARQITWIVDPEYRGHGIGIELYRQLLTKYRAAGVCTFLGSVAEGNKISVKAHEKFKAEKIGSEWVGGVKHHLYCHDVDQNLLELSKS